MYHSEYGQDRWLNENVFKNKKNGVFFEAGALDGRQDSNSLFFEEELGWTGLLAEANPDCIPKIRENRKCEIEHCAILNASGFGVNYLKISGGLYGWGGIVQFMEPKHWDRILKKTSPNQRDTIRILAITLHDLLIAYHITQIDYLTLDIEGAELAVIEPFPFHMFNIEIFEIENNFGNEKIGECMRKNGFDLLTRIGVSDIYRKI